MKRPNTGGLQRHGQGVYGFCTYEVRALLFTDLEIFCELVRLEFVEYCTMLQDPTHDVHKHPKRRRKPPLDAANIAAPLQDNVRNQRCPIMS